MQVCVVLYAFFPSSLPCVVSNILRSSPILSLRKKARGGEGKGGRTPNGVSFVTRRRGPPLSVGQMAQSFVPFSVWRLSGAPPVRCQDPVSSAGVPRECIVFPASQSFSVTRCTRAPQGISGLLWIGHRPGVSPPATKGGLEGGAGDKSAPQSATSPVRSVGPPPCGVTLTSVRGRTPRQPWLSPHHTMLRSFSLGLRATPGCPGRYDRPVRY
ncbi:hypothetical protein NDU88_004847 [Pleurodeles waltl]|uniref:Secreted protein n=1 Tax=Pleurodeles waltl TaxID=8319 RepID=A0AAV7TSP9_PLEWA|nr:hypothetical protein NDU88_004847 [Pleurodeles waltl]